MAGSKILLRSLILDTIYKLKSSKNYSDKNIDFIIENLKKIDDVEFLISIILKEINCQDGEFDCVLSIILRKIEPNILEKQIWELLNIKTVSDRKKLFLINILRSIGAKVDYEQIQQYISNPDEIIDLETKNFLQIAKINPEAQIDFLDFFFTVSESDKALLLNSIIEDYTGDELANVAAPIIYHNPFEKIVPTCIEALKKSKSYLAFEPLNWILENVEDASLKQLSKKAINELKLMGLREIPSRKELFKEALKGSSPLGFWASTADGADNFSLIFARQKNSSEISTFFTVVNMKYGASACFGFDSIVYAEFEKILKRFFANSYMIPLEISIGQKLLENSIQKAHKSPHKIPYELLCWRNLTYDIESSNLDVEKHFAENLEKINLTQFDYKRIINEDFIQNWFFKSNENKGFDELINKIFTEKPKTIEILEDLIEENLEKIFSDGIFDKKLLYQAYFLKKIELNQIANILFSLIEPSNFKSELQKNIIKKSIYQFFLTALSKEDGQKIHLFTKKQKNNAAEIDAEFYINLIEAKWIK